jgi:hypothetical protein
MSAESASIITAFWSWVSAILATLLLGLMLPATLGGMTGLLPLVIRRRDWRALPELALACLLTGAPGVFALYFVHEGAPVVEVWVALITQIALLTFVVTIGIALQFTFKRIRRDRQALDAVRSFVPEESGPVEAQRPTPRTRLGAIEAEYYVAEWMRWLGAIESEVTRARRDGGVDVRSAYYVAQVKHRPNDFVSVDIVRALHGVASQERRAGLVFASGRYSSDALAFAARAGVALFIFRPVEGKLVAANALAQRVYHDGLRTASLQSA